MLNFGLYKIQENNEDMELIEIKKEDNLFM